MVIINEQLQHKGEKNVDIKLPRATPYPYNMGVLAHTF